MSENETAGVGRGPQDRLRLDLEWARDRVERLAGCFRFNAGRFGPKLLKGHGYPNEAMSEAQDALALDTVLAALAALDASRPHQCECAICRVMNGTGEPK